MTYEAFEISGYSGTPVELYDFVQGSLHYRYTSACTDVIYGGYTYSAIPLTRENITQNDEMNQAGISIKLPRDNTLASLLSSVLQEAVCTLTIFRGHTEDPDHEFAVYWRGRVVGISVDGSDALLNCESVYTSLRRAGLRARYQKMCRHSLYGRGCFVDKSAFGVTYPISQVSGVTATIPGAAGHADGWFTGGMLQAPDGSLRFIMQHVGDILALSRVHVQLASDVQGSGWGQNYGNLYGGVPVILYPGCDHSMETCNLKFSNLPNYGGFPFIPTKNPMGGSSIV